MSLTGKTFLDRVLEDIMEEEKKKQENPVELLKEVRNLLFEYCKFLETGDEMFIPPPQLMGVTLDWYWTMEEEGKLRNLLDEL